ncbi:MAG TPA: type II toxin-antitoxin system VapC family toxin [Acidobacteriota bacterium]|nr:type II toxin-antitoxin system VapC family toxin [Acidobacteriota bacterium]
MSTVYLETSAVLTWLLGEPHSKATIMRINRADNVVTSVLTLLETERALIRAEKQKLLTAADSQGLKGMLAKARGGWALMEVTEEVRQRAGRAFPIEPLRTLDAIHISTALLFTGAFDDLQMLSYDQRIMKNAQALGMV